MKGVLVTLAVALACSGCQVVLGIDPNVAILDGSLGDSAATNLDGPVGDGGVDAHASNPDGPLAESGPPPLDGGGSDADASKPTVLAHATGMPTDIAIDATFVYWSSDDGSVWRVGKDGTGGKALVNGLPDAVAALALDATHVYFVTASTGLVYAMGKDGSSLETIATGQPSMTAIATGLGGVYWLANVNSNAGAIMRATLGADGGAPITTPYPGRAYLGAIVIDTSALYWDEDYGSVEQGGGDGGAVVTLANCIDSLGAMAIDATNVYWSSDVHAAIYKSAKGDPETINGCAAPSQLTLATNEPNVNGMAVVGTSLFWTSQDAGHVKTMQTNAVCAAPPCGQLLAGGLAQPEQIVADSVSVYWIDQGDGTVDKIDY